MAKKRGKETRPPKDGIPEWLSLPSKLAIESERGCVLLAAAAIEDAATSLIKTHFEMTCEGQPQDNARSETVKWMMNPPPTGPLGSFWAKVSLCYCLGFIPQNIFDLLDYLRNMRNDFAHLSYGVEIREIDLERMLSKIPDWGYGIHEYPSMKGDEFWKAAIELGDAKEISEHRKKFIGACVHVTYFLQSRERYLRENYSRPWPTHPRDWLPILDQPPNNTPEASPQG